ncbi:MAG: type II secretion system F family protein, partial [Gordonia sp. (in: high G+C Gram-positive bacteria)]
MTVGIALIAIAGTILLWPVPEATRRLQRLVEHRGPARPPADPVVAIWLLPAVAATVFGPAAAIAGTLIAALVTQQRRKARRDAAHHRDIADLIAALGVMGTELSVGAPVSTACRAAATELAGGGEGSVARELARMAARAELGGDPGGGVGVDGPVRRLAQAWTTSLHFGLPMGDMLAALRADLVARQDFAARTRAGMAGPRATAVVLAGLPVLGLALGQAMG